MPSPLLQFFGYSHLPNYLQDISEPFCVLAHEIDKLLPNNIEKETALRKLLESRDCAMRAVIFADI